MTPAYAPLIQQMMLEFQNQRLESAERIARSILRVNSKDLLALQVQGLCLAMQGHILESVSIFLRAVTVDPKNAELLTNLAKAQHGAHLYADACDTYKKLDRIVPNNAQILTDMGTSNAKARRYDLAQTCYDKAVKLQPDYFLVWSNYGNLLREKGSPELALEYFEKSINLNSDYAESWTNFGNTLFDLERYEEALSAHDRALTINPEYAEAWVNRGNTLIELKLPELMLASYQHAFELKPGHPLLIGQLFNAYRLNCDWAQSESLLPNILQQVERSISACPAFVFLQTPGSLALQLKCAKGQVRHRIHTEYRTVREYTKKSPGKKIKIAYFSSDFKNHPVGILMKNLIPFHDRAKFEIYGYSLNRETGDQTERAILSMFDQTFNLSMVTDENAAKAILDQEIDVAIDLNGHTDGARTALFSYGLAPLQLSYLGYAGTSGTNFYDYIVADRVVLRAEDECFFTEKVAYLPNSFFPVDTSIKFDEICQMPTRASQGLPDDAFVFSCFNNTYKISPQIFDIWMRLLKKVPSSILWLASSNAIVIKNLRKSAELNGIDPARLIFANREEERVDHLRRLRLSDLFLDTINFNAHSTAADFLWAGVPVLTMMGNTFAGRVAASQLTALELPELITYDLEEYFQRALQLASDSKLHSEVKAKLELSRISSTLFDTKNYVKNLELLITDLLQKSY